MSKAYAAIVSAFVFIVSSQMAQAQAQAAPLKFQQAKTAQDVFTPKAAGQATILVTYMPFLEWKEKQSGKYFPMEVAPVFTGMATGGVALPQPKPVDPSKYTEQAAEFAKVVNFKNQGGRAQLEMKAGVTPQKLLNEAETTTHVVQTVLSTVVDRSIPQLGLSTEKLASMVENIDIDHYHFKIPGSFVLEALEQNHVAARTLNLNRAYLLSVIDFRDYGCAAMKDGLRDYFSKETDKQKLMNESIYLISDLDMNSPADISQAEKFFGKKPDAVLAQNIIYADHLIRGGRTIFLFFAEGAKTRVVLVSNIAMRSKFFTGVKGALTRQYILDGIGGGVSGAALKAKDAISDLLAGATSDVNSKNSCDRGLARGLTKYSEGLFGEFANYIQKN